MKNQDKWTPSIFLVKNGELTVNKKLMGKGSSLILDLSCKIYNKNILPYVKGKLLDLGCGFVPLYEFYKNNIEENICIDWENSAHKNEFLDLSCDISKPLPFANKEFDSILSTAVLEHIYEPQYLIKECNRLLKSNGNLILSSNFSYWEHEAPHDYLRHTQYFYKKMAEDNGFEIKVLEPIGDGMCVIADIFEKIHYSRSRKKIIFKLFYKITDCLARMLWRNKKPLLPSQPLAYFVVMEKINDL